jgi:hypothetical protein
VSEPISTPSAEPRTTDPERQSNGRFAPGNRGGPGNPFARKTAALRAKLINLMTEQDVEDIYHVLLLNAKSGHLPAIKFLFSYVLGKPQPAVNPDALDVQEMQLLQQAALLPEQTDDLCRQLPLPFTLQLLRFTQAGNELAAVNDALDAEPDPVAPRQERAPADAPAASAPSTNGENGPPPAAIPDSAPSTNGENGPANAAPELSGPSTNGEIGRPPAAEREKRPSTNGENRRRPRSAGFDWLRHVRQLAGACGKT